MTAYFKSGQISKLLAWTRRSFSNKVNLNDSLQPGSILVYSSIPQGLHHQKQTANREKHNAVS